MDMATLDFSHHSMQHSMNVTSLLDYLKDFIEFILLTRLEFVSFRQYKKTSCVLR